MTSKPPDLLLDNLIGSFIHIIARALKESPTSTYFSTVLIAHCNDLLFHVLLIDETVDRESVAHAFGAEMCKTQSAFDAIIVAEEVQDQSLNPFIMMHAVANDERQRAIVVPLRRLPDGSLELLDQAQSLMSDSSSTQNLACIIARGYRETKLRGTSD